jgi:parvulin-like peptidyl-prolyl isomerase
MLPQTMIPHRPPGVRPLCLYALFFIFLGCGKTAVLPSSPIVAMVDDDSISLKELKTAFMDAELKDALDETSESVRELKRNLLNQLIEHHLFLAEAARLKLEVGEEEMKRTVEQIKNDYAPGEFETMLQNRKTNFETWREELRQELLAQKVVNQAVPQKIQIPEEDVQSYYKLHLKDFMRPAEVRARQIVVANEEAAKAIRLQLTQGADFALLASDRSLSPDKERGGDLGLFAKGEMPEEFDIVFTLAIGKISPIVKTAYGYHIFKVEERHPAKPMPPSEAAERIRAQLAQEQREKLFISWVAGLKGKARITINNQILFQPIGRAESPSESAHD